MSRIRSILIVGLILHWAAGCVNVQGQKVGTGVLVLSEQTLRSRSRFQRLPEYPNGAVKDKAEGIVVAAIHTDEQGLVTNVEILQSAHHLFDEVTVRALRGWKFSPMITPDGKHFRTKGKMTFYFHFKNGHGWAEHPLIFTRKK